MWVEGNDNIHDFCKKRFGEHPTFVENFGKCGNAKICKNTSVTKKDIGTMSLHEITEKIYNTYCMTLFINYKLWKL